MIALVRSNHHDIVCGSSQDQSCNLSADDRFPPSLVGYLFRLFLRELQLKLPSLPFPDDPCLATAMTTEFISGSLLLSK